MIDVPVFVLHLESFGKLFHPIVMDMNNNIKVQLSILFQASIADRYIYNIDISITVTILFQEL